MSTTDTQQKQYLKMSPKELMDEHLGTNTPEYKLRNDIVMYKLQKYMVWGTWALAVGTLVILIISLFIRA